MKLTTLAITAALLLTANSFVIRRDACTTNDDCALELYCKDGECKALGKPGDYCDDDSDCEGETPCTNNVCGTGENTNPPTTNPPEDDPCGSGKPCECDAECTADEKCVGGVCTKTSGPGPTPGDFSPDTLSIYHVDTGAIEYNVGFGYVSKTPGSGADTSTLMTFTFPANTQGKQCEIALALTDEAHFVYDGVSQNIDVFTNLYPATESTTDWPAGNGRNINLGRLHVVDGGMSTVEWGNLKFPCPAGQTLGYELVATGDEQYVAWWAPDGAIIKVTDS